jgi:hypothetical protein
MFKQFNNNLLLHEFNTTPDSMDEDIELIVELITELVKEKNQLPINFACL